MKTKIREWYMKEFPSDDVGGEIKDNIDFEGLFDTLDNYKNVYDFIGISDSVVRERIFKKLAKVINTDYGYVYDQWIKSIGTNLNRRC